MSGTKLKTARILSWDRTSLLPSLKITLISERQKTIDFDIILFTIHTWHIMLLLSRRPYIHTCILHNSLKFLLQHQHIREDFPWFFIWNTACHKLSSNICKLILFILFVIWNIYWTSTLHFVNHLLLSPHAYKGFRKAEAWFFYELINSTVIVSGRYKILWIHTHIHIYSTT